MPAVPNLAPCLARLRAAWPELVVREARAVTAGQYNVVIVVNEELIVRFPRFAGGARRLGAEIATLAAIGPRVPVPIPQVVRSVIAPETSGASFLAYPLLPGEPLRRAAIAGLGEAAAERLATGVAAFLRALHAIPTEAIPSDVPLGGDVAGTDWRAGWRDLYDRLRARVYPLAGGDVRAALDAHFAPYLADDTSFAFTPALIHGDFGPGNVLRDRDTGAVAGIIDFGSAGIGDPACDLASLLTWGDDLARRVLAHYPALAAALPRARFYRGTFAAQEALYGAEHGDAAALAAGLAAYTTPGGSNA